MSTYTTNDVTVLQEHYSKLKDKVSYDSFIDSAHDLLQRIGADPYHVRMALQRGKSFMEFGSRAAYRHSEGVGGIRVGFLLMEADVPQVPQQLNPNVHYFEPRGQTALVKFTVPTWADIPAKLIALNEKAMRWEYERIKGTKLVEIRRGSGTTNEALKHCIVNGISVEGMNGSMGLIMMNLTWNSNDWKGPSDDASNHRWVKEGNVPSESWNFDFDNVRNTPDHVYGYAQHVAPPKLSGKNNLVIFHSDGKVVGFYGKAELIKEKVPINEDQDYNIIGDRALSLVLGNKLEGIKAKGYIEDKQRMGQNGFIYLKEHATALRMIAEAIDLNPAQKEQLVALRKWVQQSATGVLELTNKTNNLTDRMHSLNTILYGPPGTGKTYHAITHAVAIIDGEDVEVVKKRDRKEVRKRYQDLFDARLVRAVTFHQSFSYEDFVEGIKPKTHEGEDEDKPKQVTYDVEDGIFKEICSSARTGGNPGAGPHLTEDTLQKAKFYKVSLGQYNNPADDPIYAYCMEHGVIAVGYGGQVDVSSAKSEADIRRIISNAGFKEEDSERHTITVLRKMHLEMEEGDIVLVSAGNSSVRAIGQVSGPYFVDLDAPIRFKQFRKVKWLYTELELPVEDIYPIKFTMGSLYDLDRNKVKLDYFRTKRGIVSANEERYVLIIDEINRGNVASIFGELITLIEDDKREGEKEAAHVKLPYSKKDFSVPKNLYLLGTMNTADRSVEALDSALRRRFSFVEMPCKEDRIDNKEVAGVKLPDLLKKINERVEQLLDKDHHIGHSYFMGLSDLAGLKRVFKNKVIPLLEEYFHGDAFKVGAVLGDAFVEKQKGKVAFANGFDMEDYEVKEIHRLKDVNLINDPEVFKAIYAN